MRTLDYSIGELASETGVKVPTILYYEGIGLIAAPPRTEGNQRRYDSAAVERLRFIAHARAMGFPMDELRAMLGDEVFSATWLVGHGLAVDRVVAEATAFILETSAA